MSQQHSGHSDHYFAAKPDTGAPRTEISVRLAGRDVAVHTAPGVFSRSGLDQGTAVLFRKVPPLPANAHTVLDLGCGWGPITLTMAMEAPQAQVWGIDVNNLALDLTRANARRLGLKNVHCSIPEDIPSDMQFDAIWSNPPIRVGHQALTDMLMLWLPRLSVGASAHLVVQHHLGADSLLRWLQTHLPATGRNFDAIKLGSAKGFRVLQITASERE